VTEFDTLMKRRGRNGHAGWHPGLRESATFDRNAIHEIQRAARTGIYDIRGWGAKRKLPHFDDLLFLGASVSRYPLEGYPSAARPMSCSATAMRPSRSSSRSRSRSPG